MNEQPLYNHRVYHSATILYMCPFVLIKMSTHVLINYANMTLAYSERCASIYSPKCKNNIHLMGKWAYVVSRTSVGGDHTVRQDGYFGTLMSGKIVTMGRYSKAEPFSQPSLSYDEMSYHLVWCGKHFRECVMQSIVYIHARICSTYTM